MPLAWPLDMGDLIRFPTWQRANELTIFGASCEFGISEAAIKAALIDRRLRSRRVLFFDGVTEHVVKREAMLQLFGSRAAPATAPWAS